MIGQHKLHPKVFMACAGNLETDNAVVESMSTALQSRLIHIEVDANLDVWLDHAYESGVHYLITSYLQFQPSNLYTFDPDHSDKTYASPRTWFFTDKLIKVCGDTKVLLPLLAGTIGEGVAREFVSFMEIEKDLPKLSSILSNPEGTVMPSEPSVLFALSGSVAEHVTKDNIDELIKYVQRMPMEHQVVCIRKMIKKDQTMMSTKAILNWVAKHQSVLF